MKITCAWCRASIRSSGESTTSSAEISHGVCPACAENLRFEKGVSLQRFIDSLSVPVLVVDGDCRTVGMNGACEHFAGQSASVQHELLGPVFSCAYSRLPGGCGRTIHCSGCAIRRAVTHTFATGEPQVSPATLVVSDSDHSTAVDLIVTTIKTEGVVLLRLQNLQE